MSWDIASGVVIGLGLMMGGFFLLRWWTWTVDPRIDRQIRLAKRRWRWSDMTISEGFYAHLSSGPTPLADRWVVRSIKVGKYHIALLRRPPK